MRNLVFKLTLALVALAVLGWLFMRSLESSRSEPFTVQAADLSGWRLAAEPGTQGGALVALRPPPQLHMQLFRQLFARAGESLGAPNEPGIALVLAKEFRTPVTPIAGAELLELARAAGLDGVTVVPRCMAHRRLSESTAVRQVYFGVFDVPGFEQFRQRVAERSPSSGFAADALSPVLILAAAPPEFARWHPVKVNDAADCMAPIAAG